MGDKVSDWAQSEHTCAVLATGQGLQDTAAAAIPSYCSHFMSEDFTGKHISFTDTKKSTF